MKDILVLHIKNVQFCNKIGIEEINLTWQVTINRERRMDKHRRIDNIIDGILKISKTVKKVENRRDVSIDVLFLIDRDGNR